MVRRKSVFNCTGPSMQPTLRPGDSLTVVSSGERTVRRGDVIVFQLHGQDRSVIHRVMSIDGGRIRTRGDHNNLGDPWELLPSDVEGIVTGARRGRRKFLVRGGTAGYIRARLLHAFGAVQRGLFQVLRPPYRLLERWGLVRKALAPLLRIKLVAFRRPRGTEYRLLLGPCIVGHLLPGQPRWRIRAPFRLVVDEDSLPKR